MTLASDETDEIRRVLAVVEQTLRERGRETGAYLGTVVRREIPGFDPSRWGATSLTRLLRDNADNLVIVGKSGTDVVWALGEELSDRDIERALGETGETVDEGSAERARLVEVRLRNFRSCTDATIAMASDGPTVLVGPNGAGKSTILHGISYLTQVTRGRLAALFAGQRDLRRLRSGGQSGPVELTAVTSSGAALTVIGTPGDDDATFEVQTKRTTRGKTELWRSPGPRPSPPLSDHPVSKCIWPSVLLRFNADALAAPSDVTDHEPRLGFDGYGLPSVLAYLANTDPDRLEQVVESVRKIVPAVVRTRQKTRRARPVVHAEKGSAVDGPLQYQLDVEIQGAGWVPADLLSEGTLFAFGIHAVLHQTRPPRILLMDDLDRGLHPRAQRTLIQQLVEIARDGGPQMLLSTHSPYVLDELPPEAVRVVRPGHGKGQVATLTDHPEWQEWKGNMTAGEFWAYVGEDWLEKGA